MSTIAELMLKIGADNAGLKSTLKDSQSSIQTAFATNPVNEFTNALEGTTNGVGALISKFSSLAAIAAGGFGFTALVDNAVKAGNAAYEMSQRLGVSSQDAVNLSRVLSMSGSDVGTFNMAMMRLDKSFSAAGKSGDLCRDTLSAVGVSLTDENGKLLPVTEQLANLAAGYEKAKASGQQQAFLMNTLGVKGLQLTKVFEDYNEKMKIASDVKGVGLNPEEMHKLSLEMDALKMQSSQLGLVFGSALAPVAQELFPPILTGLKNVSSFLAQNKAGVIGVTEEALKLYAAYKLASMAQSAISTVKTVAQGFTGSNAGEKAAASELSDFQQKMIEKSVTASERGYMRKVNAAVKAANEESNNANEAADKIAIAMSKIVIDAEAASVAIREKMTAAFNGAATSAEESATAINVATASTGVVAEETAVAKTVATTESAVACTAAVAESSAMQAESIAGTGVAAEEAAAVKTAATAESAEACTVAVAESSATQGESIAAVGVVAEETGAKQVTASESAVVAANEVAIAEERVAEAEVIAGDEAVTAGTKMETASKAATVEVNILAGAVNLLRQNWLLVAYATYEALSWLVKYANERNKVKSYNPNAEVFKGEDGKYYKKRKYEGPQQYDTMTGQPIDNTNNYEYVELSPEELEGQNNYENPPEYTPPKMPDLSLPSAGDYGKEPKEKSSKDKESAEDKAADKARQKEISEANKFAEQLNKQWSEMYETKSDISKAAYEQELVDLETWHNDGLVSDEDYNADLLKLAQVRTVNLINEQQKQVDAERGYQKSAIDLVQKLQDLKDDNLTGASAAAAAFQKEWDKALQDVKDKVDDIVSKLNNMTNPIARNDAIRAYQSKGLMKEGDYSGKEVNTEDFSLFSSKANSDINNQYTSGNKAFDNAYNQGRIADYQNMLNSEDNLDKRHLSSQQTYMNELKDLWTKTNHTIYDDYATVMSDVDSGLTDSLDKFVHGTESAGGVFRSFAQSVIDSLIKIQAQAAAASITSALGSLFGMSTGTISASENAEIDKVAATIPYSNAAGGAIYGPGTGTSDSILSWLSNGEYVLNAATTAKIGVANLDNINRGYASGGLVIGPSPASVSGRYSGVTMASSSSTGVAGGGVKIIVNNNSSANVTATDGGIDVNGIRQIMIEVAPDAVLNKAANNHVYANNLSQTLSSWGR
ncbi:MAG: hypothetical protein ABFC57_12985 [Veillonellales bacterium]